MLCRGLYAAPREVPVPVTVCSLQGRAVVRIKERSPRSLPPLPQGDKRCHAGSNPACKKIWRPVMLCRGLYAAPREVPVPVTVCSLQGRAVARIKERSPRSLPPLPQGDKRCHAGSNPACKKIWRPVMLCRGLYAAPREVPVPVTVCSLQGRAVARIKERSPRSLPPLPQGDKRCHAGSNPACKKISGGRLCCAVGSTLPPGKFPFLSQFVPFKEGPWPGLRSARRAASRPNLREINAATPGLTRLARRLFRPRDGPLARVRDAGSPWLQ
ncbi:hypothetical protein AAG570_005161 [Ranatra chinensis]|uniref:Uncharacterized protein n=1 Tax=Ranatra chinensis TaxID=642074 RepID=A0ABD0YHZ0_9HEMI